MKLKSIGGVLLMLSMVLVLTDCKKGEDDPFISLRSRKTRVEGDWTMKSGKSNNSYTTTYNSSGTLVTVAYSQNYTFKESSYEHSHTDNGVTGTSKGSSAMTMKFEKNGKVSGSRTMDGETSTYEGTWNFTGKIGDHKNKEQIVIHYTSAVNAGNKATYLGNYTDLTYNIKELRNKKMVITSSYSDAYTTDNEVGTGAEEYTLEQ